MKTSVAGTSVPFDQIHLGDQIEVVHRVSVGLQSWTVTTQGKVLRTERRAQGLHFPRTPDEKTYCDLIVLERPDHEQTTVTLDEFTQIRRLP